MRFLKPSDICQGSYAKGEARCLRGWAIHFITCHVQRRDFFYDLTDRLHRLSHLFSVPFRPDSKIKAINDKAFTDQDFQLLCDAFNSSVSFFRNDKRNQSKFER